MTLLFKPLFHIFSYSQIWVNLQTFLTVYFFICLFVNTKLYSSLKTSWYFHKWFELDRCFSILFAHFFVQILSKKTTYWYPFLHNASQHKENLLCAWGMFLNCLQIWLGHASLVDEHRVSSCVFSSSGYCCQSSYWCTRCQSLANPMSCTVW